jgi:hypothetical protein
VLCCASLHPTHVQHTQCSGTATVKLSQGQQQPQQPPWSTTTAVSVRAQAEGRPTARTRRPAPHPAGSPLMHDQGALMHDQRGSAMHSCDEAYPSGVPLLSATAFPTASSVSNSTRANSWLLVAAACTHGLATCSNATQCCCCHGTRWRAR